MRRIFLDTNALLDLVLARYPQRHQAMRKIVADCQADDARLLVASLSLKDMSYLLECGRQAKAHMPDANKRRAISREARDFVLRRCVVCAVDGAICQRAHLNVDEQDYDDALIAECALSNSADIIITSDERAFVTARTPKASPEVYARDHGQP